MMYSFTFRNNENAALIETSMDKRNEFRNLATGVYMPRYDYQNTAYSFRTVHYVSPYNTSYCRCACALEHELLSYISDDGVIDQEVYDRVVDNIVRGNCPHAKDVKEKFVSETSITGMHLVLAVYPKDAPLHYDMYENSGIFHLSPVEIGILKNNWPSISAAETQRSVFKSKLPEIIRSTRCNEIEICQRDSLEFCIVKGHFHMLMSLLNRNMVPDCDCIASALSFAMKIDSSIAQHCLLEYIQEYIQDGKSNPSYRGIMIFSGDRMTRLCAECAILYDNSVLLTDLLKDAYLSEIQSKELENTATFLKRGKCQTIMASFMPSSTRQRFPSPNLLRLIDSFVRFFDDFRHELKPLLKDMLSKQKHVGGSKDFYLKHKPCDNKDAQDPSLLHIYLFSYVPLYQPCLPVGSCRRHIETMTEIDGDVNCFGMENKTALDYFLCNRSYVCTCSSRYREILETLIFENSDIEMNPNVVQSAFRTDLECQKRKHSSEFCEPGRLIEVNYIEQGKIVMDGKEHGLFEESTDENRALNFTAPLLIECGYIVNRQTRQEILDAIESDVPSPEDKDPFINPNFKAYFERSIDNPRRLTHTCRDVLRKTFKGRTIQRFVQNVKIPVMIQDFILLKPVLRYIFPENDA